MSPAETDALYQRLPQNDPVTPNTSGLQLEDDEEVLAEQFVAHERVAGHDKRIVIIHLILGSAVLLPWNGASSSQSLLGPALMIHFSLDNCNALFLIASRGLSVAKHIQLILVNLIYRGEFPVSRACHKHSVTGL